MKNHVKRLILQTYRHLGIQKDPTKWHIFINSMKEMTNELNDQ